MKYAFATFWVLGLSALIAYQHALHHADLSPAPNASLALPELSSNPAVAFGVLHFVTPACSCSNSIIDHLLDRGPLPAQDAQEMVYVIDGGESLWSQRLSEKGFRVQAISTERLEKDYADSLRGVPLLVIFDRTQTVRYAGGYTDQQITPFSKIDVKSFLDNVRDGEALVALPVKGCAVSQKYQKILDPLGLKYAKEQI